MFLCFILVLPFASAWGIAYAQNHFTAEPGQKLNVSFTLQNYVGDEIKRIIIEPSGDKEIVTILDKKDYYLLPPKTKDHQVILQIAIPEPAKKKYQVDINFIAYSGSEGIVLSNAKVIPLSIAVPDGTLNDTAEPAETPADLAEAYQEAEEKIEKEEGQPPKTQGLVVLEEGSNPYALLIILTAVVFIVLLMLMTSYRQRKLWKKMGLR